GPCRAVAGPTPARAARGGRPPGRGRSRGVRWRPCRRWRRRARGRPCGGRGRRGATPRSPRGIGRWRSCALLVLTVDFMSLGVDVVSALGADGAVAFEVGGHRSEEHTSELQSRENLVCRLLLEKKKTT